jgi:hypothetical protein
MTEMTTEMTRNPHNDQETTMTTFAATLYRDVTCAAAAILITFMVSASFVQSTSAAPFQVQSPAAVQLERA